MAGRIFTVAGGAWSGPADGRGLATAAQLTPNGMAALPDGGFLVADPDADRILRVLVNGRISTVAGNGRDGFKGDGGPATAAILSVPDAVAALPDGGFLIADAGHYRVRRVWPDGHISTVAGNGQQDTPLGDGGPATAATLDFIYDVASLVDGGFAVVTVDGVRRVWPDGHISMVDTSSYGPESVAALPDGGFLMPNPMGAAVTRVWLDGHISTVAGNLHDPTGVAALSNGGTLIADSYSPDSNRLQNQERYLDYVSPGGRLSRLAGAGAGVPGYFGEGGAATADALYDTAGYSEWVASLADGDALLAFGNSIHLIVGPQGTNLLAAAIRPLAGTAYINGYRLRIVLTKPAHVTLRLYQERHTRPVAQTGANRPAGESDVIVKCRCRLPAGLYAVDLRADSGQQSARTSGWVYLGRRLTARFVHDLQDGTASASVASATQMRHALGAPLAGMAEGVPGPYLNRCQQMGPTRVDCSWFDGEEDVCSWMQSSFASRQGQIFSRDYACGAFKRNPKWSGGRSWEDLSTVWR